MEEDEGAPFKSGKNTAIDFEKLERDIEEQRRIGLQPGKLNDAVDALLSLEKQMRLAADITGTKATVLAIVKLCRDADAWKALNDNITLLSKRRAQLKQAVASMVQECMKYVDEAPDDATRVELIKTLSTVTAGKIYVEIERARLVKRLAKMKEAEGNIKEAAETMQELAVETFGAMAKTEKIAFILEQVRLCLDCKDYMRAQILSKKISPRAFSEGTTMGGVTGAKKKEVKEEGAVEAAASDVPPLMALKLKYYELMIRYYRNSGDYLEICRCYQNIYETADVQADQDRWMPALKRVCWFVVLAPHGSMQSSLLHSTYADPKLQELPQFKSLLKQFITMEVIAWPQLEAGFAGEMVEAKEDVFSKEEVKKDLQLRVIQHYILVISKYYSRIAMKRLTELLSLSVADAEQHLSDMVVQKVVTAKIDRPAGIVTFGDRVEVGEQALDKWASGITRLLELVETSCHHIHKESMVHKVALKS